MYKTILFLLLMITAARADVYVMTNSDNSVIGLSEQNDMVVPNGNKVSKINGTIANLPISGDPTLYNFSNGGFTLNSAKVSAQKAAQQEAIAKQQAIVEAKASAIEKIQAALEATSQDSLTTDEIKALGQ